jgi:hypothetical protein
LEIHNLQDLKKASEEASILLQKIQDYCELNDLNRVDCDEAKVRFPRGFIRTASTQKHRFPFITNGALKSNLAYTLILTDVVFWLNLRTDLSGTASEMLIKLYAFLAGSMCESITKEYLAKECNKGFKPRNEYMFHNKIISQELKDDLDWLWDTRNRMHLFQLDVGEYVNDYDIACHRRSIRAFRGLIDALNNHSLAQATW